MKRVEIIEKRKAREKHFLKENGEMVAEVYDEDIHYLKNGKYKEINNALVKNKNHYVNKSNDFKTYFGEKGEQVLKIVSNNNEVEIDINGKKEVIPKRVKSNSKLFSSIIYQEILDNIDIEYKIMPSKVKEDIILKNVNSIKNDIVFKVKSTLNLKQESEGIIGAYKENQRCFIFENPYMVDANGTINNDVRYELVKNEEYYELKLILNKEWLESPDRKYPVIIDPTITNSGKANNVYDTYIYLNDTNVTRYNKDILKVGVEKINGTNRINRALLKFELPTIGTGSQVVEARLNLIGYPISNNTYDRKIITVHEATSNWDETTANWNNMSNNYNKRVEGCFQSSRSTLYPNNTIDPSQCGCYITSLVKKWYEDTPNYGIMLKLNEEVYTNNILPSFYSKNNNVSGDNPKPLLIITYRNQNGLEDYMEYYSQELTKGTVYENLYNGNLTAVFDIGSTIGGKLPVSLNLIYNTNDVVLNNNIGYGLGNRLSLCQTIKEVQIENITYLEYTDEDGTIHYFEEKDGKYYDEDGLNLTITKNSNTYTMLDKEGNEKLFNKVNNIGYLQKYTDVSKNQISIIYDENDRISKIIDANSQEIKLIYENDKTSIISPDETIYLNYLNNKLINITTITGITAFTYNDNNVLSSITDENNKKFIYEYYNQKPYRVKKVKELGTNEEEGNLLNIIYSFNNTKIIDKRNRTQVVTFNSWGNSVSIMNLESDNNIVGAYGKREGYSEIRIKEYSHLNNKLLSEDTPERYVNNLLKNTSFEEEILNFTSKDVLVSISDEGSHTGYKSLKLVSESNDKEVIQNITVSKGNYYTFSSYIKNTNNIKLTLEYLDENNELVISESNQIEPNENFTREDVTIYYSERANSDLTIKIKLLSEGITYIDNIQLEEGEVANNYNYIDNSDFSKGLDGWTLSCYRDNSDEQLPTENIFRVVKYNDTFNTLKVNMNPSNKTVVEKEFKINGKKGEIYNLSFWYKNMGVKGEPFPFENSNVYLYFDYGDDFQYGHEAWTTVLNSDCEEWQYCATTFVAEGDYTTMKLKFTQQINANELYITNLNLYKDLKTIGYNYDTNGNIISIKGLNKESDSFNYDKNNQLIKMTNPRGKNFTFEYDNKSTDRVINGVSGTGICNIIIYDDNENPITTRIAHYNQNNDITNGLYKIRVKGIYKYLKNINNYIKLEEDYCGHNKWYIEKQENFYRIKHSIITNKYISIQNNKLALSSNIDDTSLFSLIKNDNGSYLIKAKQEDKYLKYNDVLELSTLEENNPNFQFYFENDSYKKFIENNSEYTEDGRFVKKTIDSSLNKVIYDTDEVTGLIKSITNPNGITTSYTYNDKKQLIKVKCKDKEVEYSYNNNNQLEQIIQDGKEYRFVYDSFLNTKSVKVGNNITLINHNYEENNGNLLSSTYGNNNTISFNYDSFDRIKTVTKMNDVYNYKYGNNGDLLKIISNNAITKFIYDSAKRIHEYRFNEFKIKYSYDKNNNIESRVYKLNGINNLVSNEFNDDDAITKINFNDQYINYNYDLLGRITNKNINDTFNTNYEYVSKGNRTSLLIKSISNNNDNYSYKYDKLDNITHIYHKNILINKYFYDEYNQLIKENNYQDNKKIEYIYDNSGNILSKKIYPLNDYNLLSENRYEYSNPDWKDQLTKFNDELITYDEIGNPLKIGNKTLTWINGRELNSYHDGKNNITYKYNDDGIRLSKTINGIETKYYLEENTIIFEQTDNNIVYYMRDEDNNLEGFEYNGKIYHYIKNIQNDIIEIIDDNYNKIASYEYDSWGDIISIKDNNNNTITDQAHIAHINPFRYRSYYYDKESKLYYLNSRYYNPEWGRFINMDSYGGEIGGNLLSHNPFIYALNNPIMNYDSDGQYAIAIAEGAALAKTLIYAVGLLAGYIATKKMTKTLSSAIAGTLDRPYYTPSIDYTKPRSKSTTKSKTKSKTKVKPAVPYSSKNTNNKKPCTTAKISSSNLVVPTSPRMSIIEASKYAKKGRNILCDDVNSARGVANGVVKGVSHKYYPHSPHSGGAEGYLPHFHIKKMDIHIWYYFIPY